MVPGSPLAHSATTFHCHSCSVLLGAPSWELAAGTRSVAWFGGPEVCSDTVVQQQPSRLQNLAADTFYFPVDVTLRDHTGD